MLVNETSCYIISSEGESIGIFSNTKKYRQFHNTVILSNINVYMQRIIILQN